MNATSPGSRHTDWARTARPRVGPKAERRFVGIAISAGVAIGPVFYATEPEIPVTQAKIAAADIAAEGARLDAAILQSRKQLTKLRAPPRGAAGGEPGEIAPLIDAYLRMIGPSPAGARHPPAHRGDAALRRARGHDRGRRDRRRDRMARRNRA
jgi:signal transduction protein with GAF and PtsI domain